MNKVLKKPPKKVPSVSEYVSAFRKTEDQMTEKQKQLLREHYNSYCNTTTATDLAIIMKYKSHGGANGQYGKLGSMVSKALELGELWVITLTLMIPPEQASNCEFQWVMRDNVAKAFEQLC